MAKMCNQPHCHYPNFGGGFCKWHQGYRDKKPKALKRILIKSHRKPTGELIFFETLWNTRERVSFVSGEVLNEFSVKMFHHVLTKGAYKQFRLYDKNIILLTPEEHWAVHNLGREQLLKDNKNWQAVFDLKEELKIEYHSA